MKQLEQIVDITTTLATMLSQHMGTEVIVKKQFLSLREELLQNIDSLYQECANSTTSASIRGADERLNEPWNNALHKLNGLGSLRSRKRPPPDLTETTEQWAQNLLAQMDQLMPSHIPEASQEIALEDIDIEQEQAESNQFMSDAEAGLQQLDEISTMMDPIRMDVDEFDDSRFKIKIKIFFDTNKKALLFLRKKSQQTVRCLPLHLR